VIANHGSIPMYRHCYMHLCYIVMVDRRNQLERREDPARLIAYAAHDLLTPLTGVNLSLSMLNDDPDMRRKLDRHQRESLATAANCADLMVRICQEAIDSIRQQQSVAKGGPAVDLLKPPSEDVPVTYLQDLIKNLQMIMEPIPKHVPLIITLDPNVPTAVLSNDLKLFRSALNLLSNASGRTASGKVHLKIFIKGDPKDLVFECEDTGEDMRIEEYPNAFSLPGMDGTDIQLGMSSVASLMNSIGGNYGCRPRGFGSDGTKLVDKNGRQLNGAIFWFSVPLVAFDDKATGGRSPMRWDAGSEGSRGTRTRREGVPFAPSMFRSGSNNSGSSLSRMRSGIQAPSNETSQNVVFAPRHDRLPAFPLEMVESNSSDEDLKMPAVVNPVIVGYASRGVRMKRCLVIEDSTVVRKSLTRALSRLGFEVQQAVDGLEGLTLLKQTLFDFVLCDFLMPVMDGLDCVKQYRQWEKENRPSYRQLIVGISAHVSVEDSTQGIQAGMDDFHPKPISIRTLTELQSSDAVSARTKLLDRLEGGSTAPVDMTDHRIPSISRKRESPTPIAAIPAKSRPKAERSAQEESPATPVCPPPTPVCLIVTDALAHKPSDFINVLETNGWNVSVVHEGADALNLLQSRNWDVVLFDDDVPNLSAFKCVEEFREWEASNRVNEQRNIFLCCDWDLPDPDDRYCILQAPSGFSGVLRKPLDASMMQQSSSKLKIVLPQ
jgi:CheY-like chemotaxis protein